MICQDGDGVSARCAPSAVGATGKLGSRWESGVKTRRVWDGVGDASVRGRPGVRIRTEPAVASLPIVLFLAGCATVPSPLSTSSRATVACDLPPAVTAVTMVRVPPAVRSSEGRKGETTVAMLVDEEGRVRDAKIEVGSGWSEFDEAVLGQARNFRFRPGMVDCEPVEMWTTVKYSFGNTQRNVNITMIDRDGALASSRISAPWEPVGRTPAP